MKKREKKNETAVHTAERPQTMMKRCMKIAAVKNEGSHDVTIGMIRLVGEKPREKRNEENFIMGDG